MLTIQDQAERRSAFGGPYESHTSAQIRRGVEVTLVNSSYRHEALLYTERDDFLATTVPFITDGLAADEAVMVAVIRERRQWLREALGAEAGSVLFVDMAELGRNPARIIPAWRAFLDDHETQGRPMRGIGEPIWTGRRPEEIAESQLHEALLNVAIDPDTPFWLLCPYDVTRLAPEVIEEAHRSHPALVTGAEYRGSHLYGGRAHVDLVFGSELPDLEGRLDEITFSTTDLHQLAPFVSRVAALAGVKPDKAADLALAVQELAASSVQRGARTGVVRTLSRSDALICEVKDQVVVHDPMTGRKASPKTQRTGLWIANQLLDLVQLRSTPDGTTVRVHHWL